MEFKINGKTVKLHDMITHKANKQYREAFMEGSIINRKVLDEQGNPTVDLDPKFSLSAFDAKVKAMIISVEREPFSEEWFDTLSEKDFEILQNYCMELEKDNAKEKKSS